MATHFSAKQIEEFRECFSFYCQQGAITSVKELTLVLRSLGLMPTIIECRALFTKYSSRLTQQQQPQPQQQKGSIDFPTLLDLIREYQNGHSEEQAMREIADGLRYLQAGQRNRVITAAELRRVLSVYGERLAPGEVDALFRDLKISPNPQTPINTDQLIALCRQK